MSKKKKIRIPHYEQYGTLKEILHGKTHYDRIISQSKCSSKPEFNASMVLLPFPGISSSLEVTM